MACESSCVEVNCLHLLFLIFSVLTLSACFRRNGTPDGTPKLGPQLTVNNGDISRSASPLPKSALGKRPFESVVDSVEVDLGDF